MVPEMSRGPMPQPYGQPHPMGPPAEISASMPTSVGVDLGSPGLPATNSGSIPQQWALPCSRNRRQQSPVPPQPSLPPQPTTLPHGTPAPPPQQPPEPTTRDREAAVAMRRLRQRQQDESEVAYHQGLTNGCPRCHKSDRLSRKGSSHLIRNLRCERCQLRIGSKRVG